MDDNFRDMARFDATNGDNQYSLTIEEVAQRYEAAGFPRSIRTLQRYCAANHLDAIKAPTQMGDIYLVTPESVARHVAELEQVMATTRFAAGRDLSRQDAIGDAAQSLVELNADGPATIDDTPRPVAPANDASHYVERLEDEVVFLRGQISTKDGQIKELTERSRETNHLIGGLQRMLTPLLGTREPVPDHRPEGDSYSGPFGA